MNRYIVIYEADSQDELDPIELYTMRELYNKTFENDKFSDEHPFESQTEEQWLAEFNTSWYHFRVVEFDTYYNRVPSEDALSDAVHEYIAFNWTTDKTIKEMKRMFEAFYMCHIPEKILREKFEEYTSDPDEGRAYSKALAESGVVTKEQLDLMRIAKSRK